ncbi:diacylglycerol kinase (ATP) [Pedobacter antarcticus]|nr:diacylglycerol kinase family protein [Pedobacter antarcticus]SFF31446.1 diacylglycerol kinase (ATP) [Pedobacter antarcticus]
MHKFIKGFGYAFSGIAYTVRTQLNFRFHLFAAAAIILAGWFLKISTAEWFSVILVSGLVLCTELMNTAIEVLVNLVSPDYNEKAGRVKDIAAGAVLIAAVIAILTGAVIFIPKIICYVV